MGWKWLLLTLAALALVAPGCAGGSLGGESEGEEEEDTAAASDAITAGTNLALGKTATQSSTANSAAASRAVDGNTGGVLASGSVTLTEPQFQPWWQVDLGSSQLLGTVVLHNRTDCCADGLSSFRIRVSEDAMSWQDYMYPGIAGRQVSFAVNRTGRYVRVQLDGPNTRSLSLAEVQIYAPPNLALGKPATQSSTANDGVASRAVDGNTSGTWSDGSVTHTDNLSAWPWWQVDLGSSSSVGVVEIYNRTDCCSDRLKSFELQVSDDGSNWQSWSHPGVAGVQVSFPVHRSARYVQVQKKEGGVLSLAEVKVYAAANAAAGAAVPEPQPTAPTGTIEGKFQVSSHGAAVYDVPLQVPPGTNGVEPRLSLVYRSGVGNGIAGVGWSLSGLPMITRCPRTVAQDGFRGAVRGDSDDRYCLDGMRLVPVTTPEDSYYVTEIDSGSKVLALGTCGGGPCTFELHDKQGNTVLFGATADSRPVLTGDRPRLWAMSHLIKINYSYFTVEWLADDGQIYPKRIEYTKPPYGPTPKQRRVELEYEARPDVEFTYLGGSENGFHVASKIRTAKRLARVKTQIETAGGFQLVRDYRLAYTTSPATGRSLLQSLTECDATGACLPATAFAWNSEAGHSFDVVTPNDAFQQDRLRFDPGVRLHAGDFDGDGKTDFLEQVRGSWAHCSPSPNCLDLEAKLFVYYSRGDFAQGSSLFGRVQPDTTDQWSFFDYVDAGEDYAILHVGDFDGDGRSDFLRQDKDGTYNFEMHRWRDLGKFERTLPAGVYPANSMRYNPGAYLLLGDYNGDGRTDFIRHERSGWAQDVQYTFGVHFSNGDGYFNAQYPQGAEYQEHLSDAWAMFYDGPPRLIPGDFDGDGKTDFIAQPVSLPSLTPPNRVYLSNGDGTFRIVTSGDCYQCTADVTNLIPGDYNGDGKTDLIVQEKGGWDNDDLHTFRVCFSRGDGHFECVVPPGDYQTGLKGDGTEIIPIEFNGDGKTDFLRREKGDWDGDLQNTFHIFTSNGDGTFRIDTPGQEFVEGDLFQDLLRADPGSILVPGDYDGDGKTDFLRQVKGGWSSNSTDGFKVYLAQGSKAVDTMSSITNGLGGSVEIAYGPLTDPAVYSRDPTATGTGIEVQAPMYVVKSYTIAAMPGAPGTHQLHYWSARMDRNGRGFQGFASIVDEGPEGVRTTEYNQTFPLTDTVKKVKVGSTQDHRRETHRFHEIESPHQGVYRVLLSREDEGQRDSGDTFRRVKEYEYDEYANVVLVRDKGRDDLAGDEVDTCTTYVNDPVLWRLGYPSRIVTGTSCSLTAAGACSCSTVLRQEERHYDTSGMYLAEVREWDSVNGTWLSTVYSHDIHGNVITKIVPGIVPSGQTEAQPLVEEFAYDPDYKTFPILHNRSGGGLLLATAMRHDPRFGVLVARTDPNGNSFTQQVDGLGRIVGTATTSPAGLLTPVTRTIWGTDADGPYRETQHRNEWTAESWRWEREYLDGMGRVRRRTAQGPTTSMPIVTDFSLDGAGQITQESSPRHLGEPEVYTTYSYDELGRVSQSTSPNGAVTEVQYTVDKTCAGCALRVETTEAAGTAVERTWVKLLDVRGETVRQIDPEGAVTTFEYDLLGRRTAAIGPNGTTTTTVFDSLGREVSTSSPDRGTLARTYHPKNGWLTKTTDGAGEVIDFQYDGLGRVTRKVVQGKEQVIFAYDYPGHANALGRLVAASVVPSGQSQAAVSEGFSYTPSGEIWAHVVTVDGVSYTTHSGYDPQGRLRTILFPDNISLTRKYNPQGFLHQLWVGSTLHAEYGQYNAAGQPGTLTHPNGTATTYQYDAARRLAALTTAGPGQPSLLAYSYTWDPLNRITHIDDDGADAIDTTQTFTYSPSGRLLQATRAHGSVSRSYVYDAAGNLLEKDGTALTYTGHRLASIAGAAVSHDGAGNRTAATRGGVAYTYEYGGEGRLKKVLANGAAVQDFAYGFTGERVKKVDADGTKTLYIAQVYEVTELPDGRRLETKYVSGPAGRVAAITKEIPPPGGGGSAPPPFGADSDPRSRDGRPPLGAAEALALALGALVLLRRRSPVVWARGLRLARAVLLPARTELARRHPVYAWTVPVVVASLLAGCARPPGGSPDHEESVETAEEALTAGPNGAGRPVQGTHYFHHNHLASASVVTNAAGVEVARAEYTPHGEIDHGASPGLDVFRAKFTGKEWDQESGLYYFGARYYDPATGTFLTPDPHVHGGPERETASLDPYAYALGNPILYTDPSGHFPWTPVILLVGAIVGAFMGAATTNGTYNPAKWDWTSGRTWAGIAVGGVVGGLTAGATLQAGTLGAVVAASFVDSVATEGLRFLSPEGNTLQGMFLGVAIGTAAGAATHGAGNALMGKAVVSGKGYAVGSTVRERLAYAGAKLKTWKDATWKVGKELASSANEVAMETGLYRDAWDAMHEDRRDDRTPERVDRSPVTGFVRGMADSVLRSAGTDDVPGWAFRDRQRALSRGGSEGSARGCALVGACQ